MEDFPGDFPGGFFWALFPTKMRRKNPTRKSAKESGGSKIKIREKSVLPKAGLKLCDKDFAEHSGELSGAICLKTLLLLENDPVVPSNCSENSLVLFVRLFGFVLGGFKKALL